jgi:hypothetical protein
VPPPLAPMSCELGESLLELTQAGLARAMGLAPNTVARWERGDLTIGSPTLVRLSPRPASRAAAIRPKGRRQSFA